MISKTGGQNDRRYKNIKIYTLYLTTPARAQKDGFALLNYQLILFQFFEFTQTLKRSHSIPNSTSLILFYTINRRYLFVFFLGSAQTRPLE